MRTITFNTTSLNSGDYITRRVKHDQATEKDLFSYNLTRERGSIIVSSEYRFKKIILEGIIKGTSADNLEANVDTFKRVVASPEKNLDIQYASGTRRYVATATNIVIARDFYHLNYAPFTVEFFISSGAGKDTSSTSYATYSIELATLENTTDLIIGGTLPPPCTIELTFEIANGISTVEVTLNGEKITVDQALSADEVLAIDTANKKVTVDGSEVDYTGRFPRLAIGVNTYLIDVSSTNHQYDLRITYTKNYL